MAKIFLIDLSSAYFQPPPEYEELLFNRLRAEDIIRERWNPLLKLQGALTYSRGLLTIASCLEQAGHHVTYEHLGYGKKEKIYSQLEQKFEIVGINCVTPTFPLAIALLNIIKKNYPRTLTLLGGSHATFLAEEIIMLYAPLVDVVVRGEGETAMVEIANTPDQISEIKGITFLVQHQSEKTFSYQSNPGGIPCDLDKLPQPAYHLLPFPLHDYAHNIMISRGCSFRCIYCIDGLYFTKLRYFPMKKVINELYFIAKQVPEGTLVHFCDSIFNSNIQYIRKLLEAFTNADFKLSFSCDLRVNTITKEIVSLMKSAGFIQYCVGIESGNNDLLIQYKQGQQLKESLCACDLIREVHPEAFIKAYWIVGLPGTTIENLKYDRDIIQKLVCNRIVNIISNKVFVPYPGTLIFNDPNKFGIFIRYKDWAKYLRHYKPVFDLQTINSKEIFEWLLTQEQTLLDSYCYILNIQKQNLKDTIVSSNYLHRQYFNPSF